jgi:hypothetical protein
MDMRASIQERVAKGAAFLDGAMPGWRDAVEPDALEIEDSCRCVCGQVFSEHAEAVVTYDEDGCASGYFSGFEYAIGRYATSEDWAHDHGFAVSVWSGSARERMQQWKDLEREWRRVIHTPMPAVTVWPEGVTA